MDHFDIDQNVVHSIMTRLIGKGCKLSLEELATVVDIVKEEILFGYVDRLISQIEMVIEISPTLNEREILQGVAKNVVEFLGAEAASIRIHDPLREEMIAFGTYPGQDADQEVAIPFEDTIAGEVVKTHQSYFVPNILKEEKYRNKEKVQKQGIHSMLAIPLSIPRFSLKDVDTEGVLQIYFKEKDKEITPLEAKIAEVFSRRASYVIAQKRIMDLQKLNLTKDRIVEQIFLKLGRREGVKMKDVFNLVIPELIDIMQIQRCALFSVTEDRQQRGPGSRVSRNPSRDWKDLFRSGTLHPYPRESDRALRGIREREDLSQLYPDRSSPAEPAPPSGPQETPRSSADPLGPLPSSEGKRVGSIHPGL